MKQPCDHLAGDLKALRYLDALNAGDLETVSALWEEASQDPVLERIIADLDGATYEDIRVNPSSLPERLGRRRWAIWGGAAGSVAAACLVAILAWPRPDATNRSSIPPSAKAGDEVAHGQTDVSRNLAPLLDARRDMDEAAMPRFVWPQENLLSASTPLNLVD